MMKIHMEKFRIQPGSWLVAAALVLASGAHPLFGQTTTGKNCTVQTVTWNGWQTVQMANPWVTLAIVPQLGGRLMQVTFDGYSYLWVK